MSTPDASPSGKTAPLGTGTALSALVVGACFMGISPVFVRLADVGPFASAFWRVGLALPLLFAWSWYEGRRDPTAKLMPINKAVLATGLFFAGDLFFWHLAILNTTIANATLLTCLAPVWVVLLSGVAIGEPVHRNSYIGLAMCLIGAGMVIGSSYSLAPERLLGDIYGLLTSVFFGLYFLAVRVARRSCGAGALTFSSTSITAAILLVVALALEPTLWPATATGLAALLALGLISHTGGQGLLAVAMGSLSAQFGSLVIFIEALAAAAVAWIIFSEALTPLQLAGGALILAGVYVARPRAT
ncbi:DMT family transporter [Ahrensia sp. R2A130]|uniref:DMT family transporter n=1 Tax=Ahrensia sp. R2A130 TaxID=744979 RepID=UPI0001E0CA06|nr:DMT family transporter [Ahrensia sp. R2A130]EFL88818.1 CoxK [Ahrensia sp. R2A130]